MKSPGFAQKIATFARQPLFAMAQDIVDKIPGRPLRLYKLIFLIHSARPTLAPRGSNSVRQGVPNDLPELCKIEDKESLFRQRFSDGEYCVVVQNKGVLLGYTWFTDKALHVLESNYCVDVDADTIYAYDAVVKSEIRGVRSLEIYRQGFQYMFDWGDPRGRKSVLVIVNFGNDAAVRLHMKLGATVQKEVVILQFRGRNWVREKLLKKHALVQVLRSGKKAPRCQIRAK